MLSVTRSLAPLLLVTTALAAAGCGGGGDGKDSTDPAEFSRAFTKATGVRLQADENKEFTTLRAPDGDYERFGVFTIYLGASKDIRDRLSEAGTGIRQYDGGVLVSSPTSARDREVARRLDQAVRAALKNDPALIPAADRACASVGIDPAGDREGSCRLPDKALTIVNGPNALKTKALGAKLVSATTGSQLPARSSYSEPARAKGRYVVVRYALTNGADAPLESLRTSLVVAGKEYSESPDSYSLTDIGERPFPIQPGETATTATAYDVPPDVAERALEEGALQLPAGTTEGSSYLSDREAVGRIRLKDAPKLDLLGGAAGKTTAVATKRQEREASAEAALKEFYRALRNGNVRYVCRRLTNSAQQRFGGASSCSQGRFVKAAAKSKAPTSTSGLTLTTLLTSQQSRATILVRGPGGFRDIARLARQGGTWRIQGTRKLSS